MVFYMNGLDLFLENVHLKISWVEKNFNFQRIRFEESWCRHVSLWEVYLVKKQNPELKRILTFSVLDLKRVGVDMFHSEKFTLLRNRMKLVSLGIQCSL